MKIRPFRAADTIPAANVIRDTYRTFNSTEGSQEAIAMYLDFWNVEEKMDEVQSRFRRSDIFFVAEEQHNIIGVVRGNKEKLTNLFVLGSQHHKGVGRALMKRFEREAIALGSTEIKLNASMYATPFYQSMGYKKTTGVRNKWGLKVQPMKKQLP